MSKSKKKTWDHKKYHRQSWLMTYEHSMHFQLSATAFSTNGKVCPQVTLQEKMKLW